MPREQRWERTTWSRPDDETQWRLSDRGALNVLRAGLSAALADGRPMPAAEIRSLLEATEPAPTQAGAELRDVDRDIRYRVTLDDTVGAVGLRSVEVIVPPGWSDRSAFRLPVQTLVSQARALRELTELPDGPDIVIGDRATPRPPRPDAAELSRLVGLGVPRAEIAGHYGRTVARIQQWLREARAERPDLDWPAPRNNRPKTPDGK